MLFSICIPTYNRANLVCESIESVLMQTFQDFEVLVIDDGSTDNTKDVIRRYDDKRIEYYYKQNGGKHTALNLGISKAKGTLFLVLDSDDILVPDCLQEMAKIWDQIIRNNDTFCGIMGRCSENGKLIGNLFPDDDCTMSYIQFHFGKNGGKYKDCCECIKTAILKQYCWPENYRTRFIPEAYVMDQIGLNYSLYCVNKIFKLIRYLEDGITVNNDQHKKKNYIGYLLNMVSKIDDVMPYTNEITMKNKIVIWWKYWNFVSYDIDNLGPRVSKITLLGRCVKFVLPILNYYKKAS